MRRQFFDAPERRKSVVDRLRELTPGLLAIGEKRVGQNLQRFGFQRPAVPSRADLKPRRQLRGNAPQLKGLPVNFGCTRLLQAITRPLAEERIVPGWNILGVYDVTGGFNDASGDLSKGTLRVVAHHPST